MTASADVQHWQPSNAGWKCLQLGCTGGDVFAGRLARWVGPSSGRMRGGDLRIYYCGTCKREAQLNTEHL